MSVQGKTGSSRLMVKSTRMTQTGHGVAARVFLRSVRFGPGELDHLGPLLGFFGDELSEVGG
jgi:hypothetical protein